MFYIKHLLPKRKKRKGLTFKLLTLRLKFLNIEFAE